MTRGIPASRVPTRDEIIYFAGFFDGEGSVSVYRTFRRGATGTQLRKTEKRSLNAQIAQVVKAPLELLQECYGGGLFLRRSEERRQPIWCWRVMGKRAVAFLEDVGPFLLVKGPDAERGLRLELSERQKARVG